MTEAVKQVEDNTVEVMGESVSGVLGNVSAALFHRATALLGEIGNQKSLKLGTKIAKLATAVERLENQATGLGV